MFHPFSQIEAKYGNLLDDDIIDAFRKPLLQVARKKSGKLTDHGKQLLPRGLISNVVVSYDKERLKENGR